MDRGVARLQSVSWIGYPPHVGSAGDIASAATESAQRTSATDRAIAPTAPAPADAAIALVVGERLGGRYLVQKFLGEGGMGAVYRALDEQLGDEVALKVVRGEALVDSLREEVRIAQRVTHPNVCRTYDLEVMGGRQFVKMEYVAGETLHERLRRDGKVAIAEALRIARGIAAGLRAAHERGIVHRDLKPGNVMLAGNRVVLMDFGIASHVANASGHTAGTLGYMAPEQIANTDVDERADLYALGCVLYEMLAGERVFASRNTIEIATRHVSVPAPDVRGKRPDVPRWLARATAGLLAKDGAPRTGGLARLVAGPRRVTRIAIPVLAIAVAGLSGAYLALASRSEAQACKGAAAPMAAVWSPAIKSKVHAAFVASNVPFAERSFAVVEHALDGYSAQWMATAVEACEATRVQHVQSEEIFEARQQCLAQRLDDLTSLARMLATPTRPAIALGAQIAFALEPIGRCSYEMALRQRLPPPQLRATLGEYGKQLAEAKAQMAAGNLFRVISMASKIDKAASAAHLDAYAAQAKIIRAAALVSAQSFDEAVSAFEAGIGDAEAGERDDIVVEGSLALATLLADNYGRNAESRVWLRVADGAARRIGVDDYYALRLAQVGGIVDASSGNIGSAVASHDKALAIAKRIYESTDPTLLWEFESQDGVTLTRAFEYARAVPHFERALELREQVVGPEHPDVARVLSNLGECYRRSRDPRARPTLERALALREKLFGPESPLLAPTLDNYADELRQDGDLDGALNALTRARRLAEIFPGKAHPDYHTILTGQGETLLAAHRNDEARAVLDEALRLEAQADSVELPETLAVRAELALAQRAWTDAESFAQRSVAAYEHAGGADHPALWRPLTALARAELAQHHADEARPLVERAMTIAQRAHLPDGDLAATRAALAQLMAR
jgi:tetratricopeptide (TPR) repeat protein/predicted Ser/Thr protein kinase